MNFVAALILLIFFICSCDTREGVSPEERLIIISEVKSTLKNYHEDVNRYGLTAEFDYLDNSDDFFWVPPGYKSQLSYDSVQSILKRAAPAFTSIKNSFDTLAIFPLSKDLASYTGRIISVSTDTSGKATTMILIETGIMVKRKEGWKLLEGQTSVIE
jgi:hypothetical protein